jgi:hypothetical protein
MNVVLHCLYPEIPGRSFCFIVFCIAAHANNPLQPVKISADEKTFLRGPPLRAVNAIAWNLRCRVENCAL